jgi:hypothetical protein
MSPVDSANSESNDEFARRAGALLEESVLRIDGRIRSRLNQARHAAIAQAGRSRRAWRFALMPAGAVAAAALVALVLWPHSPSGEISVLEGGHASVEDLDLLADSEAMDLVSEGSDGSFYEWAVDQTQSDNAPETSS